MSDDIKRWVEQIKPRAEAIASRYDWVDQDWAFTHFGSLVEAQFVSMASPKNILSILDLIEQQAARIVALESASKDAIRREAFEADAARYRWLRDTLHGAKAGGGVEVNDALQVYETPEPMEEVRLYWYQDTPVGFFEITASTLDEAIDEALSQKVGDQQ